MLFRSYLITGNPDVTFEEYVKNYGSARRIIEEYEREKAAKNKPTTTPSTQTGPPTKTDAELAKEEAQTIVDNITSLRDIPNLKSKDDKESTARILEMIALGNLKSADVIAMVETKRNELIKNLTINDLEKGDFITFTDGRKGWIKDITKEGNVQMKIIGTPKGEYSTMDISDIIKNIMTLDDGKQVSTEPEEEVVITPDSKEAIEASRDVMNEFVTNAAKIKEINDQNEKLGTDNSSNENDLLNSLGCNTKG